MKHAHLYDFDPLVLAWTETEMWRAYYDRRPGRLLRLAVRLLNKQLAFNRPLALYNAYRLTRAAFVFKRGRQRTDYEKALRWLEPFYRSLKRRVKAGWEPRRLAELELEWWIVHRHDFGPDNTGPLERSLAALCSRLYGLPAEQVAEYAQHRARAMLITDQGVRARERGEPVEPDWKEIELELEKSYGSLSRQLTRRRTSAR